MKVSTRGGLRLTGGEYRGRRVQVPPGARPTEAQVREALFSIWRDRLAGCRFLDLFAGSGAVGLEALGRGAGEVVGIDGDPKALAMLRENAGALGVGAALRGLRLRLPGEPASLERRLPSAFDLAFADPPYEFDAYPALLEAVSRVLAPAGEVAVEHRGGTDLPEESGGLYRADRRTYGSCSLSFYRRTGDR